MHRQHTTLAVLGHVDHGKTALVRALTGMETDRLAEERSRGLSIVPGYAWFEREGHCVDLIDAPGHQAFVRAMIGAASGVDAALLVIDVVEGIMPQTIEHVGIAAMLGVTRGVVALSKCDLVDPSTLARTQAVIRAWLDDTCLADAALVPVSTVDGRGIDTLVVQLLELAARPEPDPVDPFLLPIDRSFLMSGFGRVVTGTVHSGGVTREDGLVLLPSGAPVDIRGIQVHGREVEQARAGERAALNLRTTGAEPIERGMALSVPFAAQASRRLDVLLSPLDEMEEGIRNGATVRLLIGTAEAQARLRLLETLSNVPLAGTAAQLRCDRDIVARPGMRFILRRNSPAATLGGGIVIDAMAPRRRRFARESNTAMALLAGADRTETLMRLLRAAGAHGMGRSSLGVRLGIDSRHVAALVAVTDSVAVSPQHYCDAAALDALAGRIMAEIAAYHDAHPQHRGMRQAELGAALAAEAHESVVSAACERLQDSGVLRRVGDMWQLSSFDAATALSDAQRRLADRIEAVFADADVAATALSSVVGHSAAARESLRFLVESGRIVPLQTRDRERHIAMHADVIELTKQRIEKRYPYPREFTVSDVRDLLQTTRRHAVPLLEHLDATGFTLRRGDLRQVRRHGGE